MNSTRKLLTAFFLLVGAPSAQAQVSVGPEIGLTVSNIKHKFNRISTYEISHNNHLKPGYRLGAIVSIRDNRRLGLTTGIYYYTKGSNISFVYRGSYYAINYTLNAIQLPVYVTAQSNAGRYGRVFGGAGMYLDYHMGGKAITGSDGEDLRIGNAQDKNIKRLDYGFALHAGYKVNNGLLMRAQYQIGFPNISAQPQIEVINSRSFAITLAYMFKVE